MLSSRLRWHMPNHQPIWSKLKSFKQNHTVSWGYKMVYFKGFWYTINTGFIRYTIRKRYNKSQKQRVIRPSISLKKFPQLCRCWRLISFWEDDEVKVCFVCANNNKLRSVYCFFFLLQCEDKNYQKNFLLISDEAKLFVSFNTYNCRKQQFLLTYDNSKVEW